MRKVLDIARMDEVVNIDTSQPIKWGLCLIRALNDPRFKNLTPNQHIRHARYSGLLMASYSDKIFDPKHAKRMIQNLRSYTSGTYSQGRIDYWCDFLDVFTEKLKAASPNTFIPLMDVAQSNGKTRPSGQHNPTGRYQIIDKTSVIDIAKLNQIKTPDGKNIDWRKMLNTHLTASDPLYSNKNTADTAQREVKFNSELVCAYNSDFNIQDDVVQKTKALYNLSKRNISAAEQKEYITFLNNFEQRILAQFPDAQIPKEEIKLLYNNQKENSAEQNTPAQTAAVSPEEFLKSLRSGKNPNLTPMPSHPARPRREVSPQNNLIKSKPRGR